jgi:hypothetical protein
VSAAVPAGDGPMANGHRWPCPLFYVNEDRTATCTCAATAPGIPMTAPTPDPGALLDRLEEARNAATPGPWIQWHAPDVVAIGTGFAMHRGVPSNPSGWVVSGASGLTGADAALIVAMHEALPALIAAARERDRLRAAVEGLADRLERPGSEAGKYLANEIRAVAAAAGEA